MSKTETQTTTDIVTQGQALDIASRALLRSGVLSWEWARTRPGQSVAWVCVFGASGSDGRIATVLIEDTATVATIGK